MKHMLHRAALQSSVATLVLTAALASAPAFAQSDEKKANDDEVIIVTGTRIAAPNLVSASQVSSMGAAEIGLRQTVLAEELLRTMPGSVPGIGNNVNNGQGGYSTLNLRGLGSTRNLALLDGFRLATAASDNSIDVNNIPTALLERVDVVTGGATTVYGADAIAGVANFITKRDFSGVQIDSSYGVTEKGDGQRWRTDITLGGNFADGRGNAVLAMGYQKMRGIVQSERDISKDAINSDGSKGGSGTSVPARINGDQYDPSSGALVPVYKLYNYAPFNYFQTPHERYNIYASARYALNDSIEAYGRAIFNRNIVTMQVAPSGMFGETYKLALSNPYLTSSILTKLCLDNGIAVTDCVAASRATGPTDPAYRELSVKINRRFAEMGPRINSFTTDMFQVWAGVRGSLYQDIKFDVYASRGQSLTSEVATGYAFKSRVQQALRSVKDAKGNITCSDSSNGCQPMNLFTDKDFSTNLQRFLTAPVLQGSKTGFTTISGNITTDIKNPSPLAQSGIGFAIGMEHRRYSASQTADATASTADEMLGAGAPAIPYTGLFKANDLYAEVIAPIVEDQPFMHKMTLEGGVRLSDYSYAGRSLTYKGGATAEFIPGIKLRGMYQHASRAPNIFELFNPDRTSLGNLTSDPCAGAAPLTNTKLADICKAQGAPASFIGKIPQPSANQINTTSGGNRNLKEEQANTITVGWVLTPEFAQGLMVSVDYYRIKVTDAISTPTVNDILDPCFGPAPYTDPNKDSPFCKMIRRNPLDGSLNGGADTKGLLLALTNQGTILTSGVDVEIHYPMPTSFGSMAFSVQGNWTRESKFKASPSAKFRECIGQYSSNCDPQPEYSVNSRLTVDMNNIGTASLMWRWISKMQYEKILTNKDEFDPKFLKIGATSYFDLSLRRSLGDTLVVTAAVQNLLNKKPPLVSGDAGSTSYNSGNTFPSTYDAIGRRFMLTTSLKF